MNTRIKGKKKRIEEEEIPPMRILEPFRAEVIEFDDKNDFIKYVNEDMETYKSLTTQKLNKMFRIPGYRITKLQGDISLKAVGGKDEGKDVEERIKKELMEEMRSEIKKELEEKVKEEITKEMENYEKELDDIHDSITKLRNDFTQLCKSLFPPE